MSSHKRITRAYQTAKRVSFNDDSKFILFSDVHRGDNSLADDFANNRNTYYHALKHYYNLGLPIVNWGMVMNYGKIIHLTLFYTLIKTSSI